MSAFSSAPPPYDAAHGALPQAQADTMPSGSKSWTQLVRGTHDELYATWDSGMLGADAPPHVRGRSLALRTDGNQFHWSEWLQSITWHERAFGPAQSVMTFATRMFRSDSFEMQAAGSSRTLASWKERTGALTIGKQKLTVQADEGLQSAAVQLDGCACRWECVGELRTVDGHRWDKCTYGLYDTQSRELLASFRWITGAPRYAVDMTLYMWDANIDEHAVLSSFTVLLYKQWCRMTVEWNNLTTQGQLAVYESIVEDESTSHTYGFVSREKAAELRERAAEIVAQNRKNNVNSGIMSTLSANAGVVAVSI